MREEMRWYWKWEKQMRHQAQNTKIWSVTWNDQARLVVLPMGKLRHDEEGH